MPRARGSRFSAIVITLCAVIAVLVGADAWANRGQVYEGVEVGAVPVGGATREGTEEILRKHVSDTLENITVRGDGRDFTIDSGEVGVKFDATATVDSAYAVGRQGNILERLADRAAAAVTGVRVRPEIDYRTDAVRAAVGRVGARSGQEPRNAGLAIEDGETKIVEARKGHRIDIEATVKNVERAIENLDGEAELAGKITKPEIPTGEAEQAAGKVREALSGPVTFTAGDKRWMLSPQEVGRFLSVSTSDDGIRVGVDRNRLLTSLRDIYGTLEQRPIEAGFVLENGVVNVTEGRIGRKIETEKLHAELKNGIFDGQREYEVPVTRAEPELTTAEAVSLKPTTVLGEYGTDYTWDTDPGRRINMSRASKAISGTVVAPGEIFSYNAVTEPLEYEDAKVIENGAVEYAEGGGLSQVSSTLYMAANLADLEIIEAHPHYAELPYIRPGFDTTVWFGALDLRFRNNTGGYILIEQWQGEDGLNHARIFGRPTGKEVEMTSEKVYEGEDSKGKPTTRWVVYKTVTRDGEVLYDGFFRRVTYKELDPYEEKKDDE